jgi:Carboxypeptidase regulatory-like domain
MKWRVFAMMLCLCGLGISQAQDKQGLLPEAPRAQPGIIVGTVIDVNDDTVPGATVVLQGATAKVPRTVLSNDQGFFMFSQVEPGAAYHVAISAQGFASWTSPDVTLKPGQYVILTVSKLRVAEAVTKLTVGYSAEELATEQVKIQEQQRIFGFIPNFYVAYDPDAPPLTSKLKFKLAAKVAFDPVTFFGVGLVAASEQAGDHPNYREGAIGYAERYGAIYTNGFTDIMIGGAILPSLLHQDPRYFYQGKGSSKSRVFHAVTSPFVCKGDNGEWQPNYSTIGGDLASAAISNAYYPPSNRGWGLFLGNFFVGTGQRAAANLAQEFILRKVTSKAKSQQ